MVLVIFVKSNVYIYPYHISPSQGLWISISLDLSGISTDSQKIQPFRAGYIRWQNMTAYNLSILGLE